MITIAGKRDLRDKRTNLSTAAHAGAIAGNLFNTYPVGIQITRSNLALFLIREMTENAWVNRRVAVVDPETDDT